MKRYIECAARGQLVLLPGTLEDYVDKEDGIETLVPKPLTSSSISEGRFDKRDFVYIEPDDEFLSTKRSLEPGAEGTPGSGPNDHARSTVRTNFSSWSLTSAAASC